MSNEPFNSQIADKITNKLGLENQGKNSFIELCKQGCEASFLAEHFYFITHSSTVIVTPNNKNRKTYKVNLRPLDSLESALGGFEKRDLKPLQKKLIELAKEVNKLNRTKLVRYIDDSEYNTDICGLPELLVIYANQFIPLLEKKIEEIGPKQRPNRTKLLRDLYTHIYECTGRWHDALVADVLNELKPEKIETEQAMKQWRIRQKLVHMKDT